MSRATVFFSLDEGTVVPEAIAEPPAYAHHYGVATIGGEDKLFYQKTSRIVRLGADGIELARLTSPSGQKLLNALTTNGERIVLDARKGFDRITRAYIGQQAVHEVFGEPQKLGQTVVQNAALETLGGTEKRVIDINREELRLYSLPDDLTASSEGNMPSVFRSNPLSELFFEAKVQVSEEVFVPGLFEPFHGPPRPVLLQMENGRPLHLEGGGFRNELVTGFHSDTLSGLYQLGPHRMIGATTLTEELKEGEIMFALPSKQSWLMMGHSFLPILRKVVVQRATQKWDYLLFELRRIATKKEYLVVERKPPHRILVTVEEGVEVPKVVSDLKRSLKPPRKLSGLRKLFVGDPGYLRELEL